jgi:hypothetical protein
MLPAEESGTSEGRRPALNRTVRSVFVIGPDKRIKLMLIYPDDGPQLRRNPARHRFAAAHRQAQDRNAGKLEAGRRRHYRRLGERRGGRDDLPRRMEGAQALSTDRLKPG